MTQNNAPLNATINKKRLRGIVMDDIWSKAQQIKMNGQHSQEDIEQLCEYIRTLIVVNNEIGKDLKQCIGTLVKTQERLEWYRKQTMSQIK